MVFDECVAILLVIFIGMITALVKEWAREKEIERRKKKNGKSEYSKNNSRRASRP